MLAMGLSEGDTFDTTSEIQTIVSQVVEDNPRPAQDYRDGTKKAIGFLVGQVMRHSRKSESAIGESDIGAGFVIRLRHSYEYSRIKRQTI